MNYDTLIIDTNNLYARAYGVVNKKKIFVTSKICETIQLAFKMILNLKKNYLNDSGTIYLLADNPTSKTSVRKKIYSDYKGLRLKESDGYYRGIDYLLLVAQNYADYFSTIRIKRLEADDIVPEIIEINQNKNILLCSSDLDWARSMSENCDWYNFVDLLNQEDFLKKFGYKPTANSVTLMKVLMGDISDSIPPVLEKCESIAALHIVLNFEDIFDVFSSIKNKDSRSYLMSPYIQKFLVKHKEQLIINHNLVYFCELNREEVEQSLIKGTFNETSLSILYNALEFPSSFDKRVKYNKKSILDIFSSFEEVKRK